RAKQSQGFLKSRLKSLGITGEALRGYDGSEIVGLTGVLQLKSSPGKGANKGKTYQNVKNVRLTEVEEEPEPAPKKTAAKKAPAKPAAKAISKEDAEAKARVKAKQAARAAAE